MKALDEIKQMMAAGDTAKAAEALKELLAKEPDNLQAKMLYGTCCQLLGDAETFNRIHDELSSEMETREKSEPQSETVSLWRKYHELWMKLIAAGLIVASLTCAVMYFGNEVKRQMQVASSAMTGYRAAPYYENIKTAVCPACSGKGLTSNNMLCATCHGSGKVSETQASSTSK